MKKTKNAFILSLTALILCVAMMTGTTFAWFTDTETNTGNKIRAGVLDIQLWQKTSTLSAAQQADTTNLRAVDTAKFSDKFPSASDYTDISKSAVPIMDYELWEPGYKTPAGSFAIANNGNLALIYTYKLTPTRSITGLQHYSETNNGATNTDKYNHLMKNNCNAYLDDILEVYDETGTTKICNFKDMDTLTGTSLSGVLLPGEVKVTSGFVLKMPETAGNEYEYAKITLDIVVEAYQKDYEKDGFGSDQYDVAADPKYVAPVVTPTSTTSFNLTLSPVDGYCYFSTSDMTNKTLSGTDINLTVASGTDITITSVTDKLVEFTIGSDSFKLIWTDGNTFNGLAFAPDKDSFPTFLNNSNNTHKIKSDLLIAPYYASV